MKDVATNSIAYVSRDGRVLLCENPTQARAAFAAGYLPIGSAGTLDALVEKIKPIVARVGADFYLNVCLDRPFRDVDELIAFTNSHKLFEDESDA